MAVSVGRNLLFPLKISASSKALLSYFSKDFKYVRTIRRSSSTSIFSKAQSSDLHTEKNGSNQLDLSKLPEETRALIQGYVNSAIAQETSRMKDALMNGLTENKASTGQMSQAHHPSESSLEFPTAYREELIGVLARDIRAHPTGPAELKLEGFEHELNKTEVTFKKKFGDEIITIRSNVINSLDVEDDDWLQKGSRAPFERYPMLKAKPDFTVEIKKGQKILSFWCTYIKKEYEEEEEEERKEKDVAVFEISKMSLYEGEYTHTTFTMTRELMDKCFYDLMMKHLEERGISEKFAAEKMIEFFSYYLYDYILQFKQDLKSFVQQSSTRLISASL